jgi:hypothetical protein
MVECGQEDQGARWVMRGPWHGEREREGKTRQRGHRWPFKAGWCWEEASGGREGASANGHVEAKVGGDRISEVTIIQSCRYCWKFQFEPKEVTYRPRTLGINEARSIGMLNIKIIGNYINSLKRVKTHNFDVGRTKREGLKLKGFLSYDFELESIFKFPLVFMVCFLMQYECVMSCNMSVLYVLTKRKSLPNIDGVCVVGGKVTLIPVVSSNETILRKHG